MVFSNKLSMKGLPTICYCCGRYGHTEDSCPQRAHTKTQAVQASVHGAEITPARSGDVAVAHEKQVYGEWMQVKPRYGRQARAARRDGQASNQINKRAGNRFNPLVVMGDDYEHEEGNHQATDVVQRSSGSTQEMTTKSKKTPPKAKSTRVNDKMYAPSADPRKTTKPPVAESSIFISSVYKESSQATTLGPDHSAVILSPRHMRVIRLV